MNRAWIPPCLGLAAILTFAASDCVKGLRLSAAEIGASAQPAAALTPPSPPPGLVARVGDRSVALHWDKPEIGQPTGYHVYRATDLAAPYSRVTTNLLSLQGFADLDVTNGQTVFYSIRAVNAAGEGAGSDSLAATPRPFSNDDDFLDLLQQTAFDFFWHEANPTNGMVRDRSRSTSFCSIAAVGFGLTAIGIGIDHGWISREAGRERALSTLQTFWEKSQTLKDANAIGYKGWFFHFLDINTAARAWSSELSSVDTAWFLAGAIYAREYFDQDQAREIAIRALANHILDRVDWTWMLNNGPTLTHGWKPEAGFLPSRWVGYNEAMLLYILGLGATTNPVPATGWTNWTKGYLWRSIYGYTFVNFPPLFGHQYSHCWIDFRHIADAYMRSKSSTYFENSRRATMAQREYAIRNPPRFPGYGSNLWGLTACDGPEGGNYLSYTARGTPPAQNDDGTIAPTAAGGSLAFTPEFSIAALRNMYEQYRATIWTPYGFCDAFNLKAKWWDPEVLGIDQGPILIMAENLRTERVWKVFMKSPEVRRGLERAGFNPVSFAAPGIERQPESGAIVLAWDVLTNRSYQVEYSPNLTHWHASATGFLTATNDMASFSWLDSGPPATDVVPSSVPQRFYRVFEIGDTQP